MIMMATSDGSTSDNDYNDSNDSGSDGHCLVLWWVVVVMYIGSFGRNGRVTSILMAKSNFLYCFRN